MTVPYIFADASGNIPLSELDENFANVKAFATTAGTVTSNAQPNITTVGTLYTLSVTGNVAGNYFVGNGSQLTGIVVATSYGNANVANYLPTFSGKLTASSITATGNIVGGNLLSGGAISTNANLTGGNIQTIGVVSAVGNITGNYILGNGALLSGLPASYSNANVLSYLPTYTGDLNPNVVTASGAISAVGNVKTSSNVVVGGFVTVTGNVTGGNILTAGLLSTTSNVVGAYILGNGSLLSGLTTYGNANVAAYLPTYSGAITAANLSATGNITGSYILGNGSQLTGLPATYGNSNVAAYLPTYSGNLSPGNITTTGIMSSTGNATHGNILTAGIVSATGNVTGNYILGNGSQLSGISSTYGNSNVAAYLPTYSGNLTAGNITTTGIMSSTGNATHGNILTAGIMSSTGNATHGNILTAGIVSATGNVTGNYFIGNGSALTGISAGALATRTSANIYTGNLAANANSNVTVVGFKTYALYSIQTSAAAWVTVYSSNAARTADASRSITTDPTPGSGVIAEVINTGANTTYLSPGVIGYSSEAVPDSNIQLKVSNTGNVSANITVTLTLLKLES